MNRPEWTARLVRALPWIVFALVPLAFVVSSLRTGRFLFGEDYVSNFYYLRDEVARSLGGGELPHWSPLTRCGAPFLASMHAGVLYPPSWICLVVGPGTFWTLTVALHLSLAGAFGYAWLRHGMGVGPLGSFVGAMVLMLSGFAVVRIYAGHAPHLCTYAWVPAVLWRLERHLSAPSTRRFVLLAASFAVLILSGFPQFALMLGIAAAARLLLEAFAGPGDRRNRALRSGVAAGAIAAGILLAAPQLLPTLELIGRAQRASGDVSDFRTTFSMPPENLLLFAAPTLFGDGVNQVYWGRWMLWETCGFVGLTTLFAVAAGAARRHPQRWLWIGVAAGALLMALGRYTPLYEIARLLVPASGSSRAPGRYLLLSTVAFAPLAAWGVERWADRESRPTSRVPAAIALALALIALGAWSWSGTWGGPDSSGWKEMVEGTVGTPGRMSALRGGENPEFRARSFSQFRGALLQAASVAAMIAAVLFLLATGRCPPPTAAGILTGLLTLELALFAGRYFEPANEEAMRFPPELGQRLSGAPYRAASVGAASLQGIGRCQAAGVEHVGGYDALLLREYVELLSAVDGKAATWVATAISPSRPHPVLSMLGVKYWIVPGRARTPAGWTLAADMGHTRIYEDPEAFPRAFRVGRGEIVSDRDARLRSLVRGEFDLRSVVVLEEGAPSDAGPDPGSATVRERSAGRYVVETSGSNEAWLVLTEAWYPGWEARIDGNLAPIHRANHFIQAVRVPTGTHEVVFRYRSTTFRTGVLLAGATAVGIAVVALLLRRRVSTRSVGSPAGGT